MSRYAGTTDVPHFVYRCFSTGGDLLYVGCSVNVEQRMSQHASMPWASAVARVETDGPHSYVTARRLETEAIRDEDPQHNANAPTAARTKRRRTWLFNEVFHTAQSNGESTSEAGRLAQIAVDSETASSP